MDRLRIAGMRSFEWETARGLVPDAAYICGIDEAGRGPLAGPVCAAAVILTDPFDLPWLNDSKKLSAARRSELYDEICSAALAYGVCLVPAERIDEINILQATYEAMRGALAQLPVTPDVLVIDAVHLPETDIPQAGIIKGDAKCASIAAASILAKVTRDRLMETYDGMWPEYGFARHKGYGTKEHMDALRAHGMTPIHRRSFLKGLGS